MDQTKSAPPSDLPPEYSSNSAQPLAGGQPPAPPYAYQAYPQQAGYGGYNNQAFANNVTVVNQPTPGNQVVVTSVDNHMGLAIFVTLCCFWPLGIMAIMRSSESTSALDANDFERAQRLAHESKRMSLIGVGIGMVSIVILIVVIVVIVTNNSYYY